jgi:hypothetical protein
MVWAMALSGILRWPASAQKLAVATHSWQILDDEGEEEGLRWFDARPS